MVYHTIGHPNLSRLFAIGGYLRARSATEFTWSRKQVPSAGVEGLFGRNPIVDVGGL